MKNINLVDGSGIVGNVGSCKTEVTKIETKSGLLTNEYQTIATNSCTGDVTNFDTWQFTEGYIAFVVLLFSLFIGWLITKMD